MAFATASSDLFKNDMKKVQENSESFMKLHQSVEDVVQQYKNVSKNASATDRKQGNVGFNLGNLPKKSKISIYSS